MKTNIQLFKQTVKSEFSLTVTPEKIFEIEKKISQLCSDINVAILKDQQDLTSTGSQPGLIWFS